MVQDVDSEGVSEKVVSLGSLLYWVASLRSRQDKLRQSINYLLAYLFFVKLWKLCEQHLFRWKTISSTLIRNWVHLWLSLWRRSSGRLRNYPKSSFHPFFSRSLIHNQVLNWISDQEFLRIIRSRRSRGNPIMLKWI